MLNFNAACLVSESGVNSGCIHTAVRGCVNTYMRQTVNIGNHRAYVSTLGIYRNVYHYCYHRVIASILMRQP